MKIAIDIRNIGRKRTGSETVIVELVKTLVENDPENTYFLLTNTKEREVINYITNTLNLQKRSNAQIVSLFAPLRVWWLFIAVATFIQREKIDLFHTEYIVPFFIKKTTKVLTHIHDVSFAVKSIRPLIRKKDLLILDLVMEKSLRRADGIIAVSEFTRDELVRYYKNISRKITVIYNASSMNKSAAVTWDEIGKKYKLPVKYIFSLGTMQPRKNIPFLISAFLEFAKKVPDIDLVLSGERSYHFDAVIDKILDCQPELAKRIHFTGYINSTDLPEIYKNAQCFVSPSLYEGFGIPIVEAFNTETPVVCSDIPAYREVAKNAAKFFHPCKIDQCVAALYTVCTDNKIAQELVKAGKDRQQAFSWKKSAQQLKALIAEEKYE